MEELYIKYKKAVEYFVTHLEYIVTGSKSIPGYDIYLWAENIVRHKEGEFCEAEDYFHIHVIPSGNKGLLDKKYRVSGKSMEETWRSMLSDQSKYVIVEPKRLFAPISDKYPELSSYLEKRYW